MDQKIIHDDAWNEQKGRDTFDAWLLGELLSKLAQQQPDADAYLLGLQADLEASRDALYQTPFPAELNGFNRRLKQVFNSARNKPANQST